MHSPQAPSPYRQELDRLAAPLATELLAGLSPLTRTLATAAIRARGWDLSRPLSTGPLAAVSDAALLRLARDTVGALLVADGMVDEGEVWPLTSAEALEELRAARR